MKNEVYQIPALAKYPSLQLGMVAHACSNPEAHAEGSQKSRPAFGNLARPCRNIKVGDVSSRAPVLFSTSTHPPYPNIIAVLKNMLYIKCISLDVLLHGKLIDSISVFLFLQKRRVLKVL